MLSMLAAFALSGCADAEPDPTTETPPVLEAGVELGSGVRDFLPLKDGGEIVIVQGPQGGHHFDGSLRAQGIAPGDGSDVTHPDNPTTTFRVFHGETGEQIDVGIMFTQGLEDTDEPGVHVVLGRKVILDIELDDDLDGVEVDFEVEVIDAAGNIYVDRKRLVGLPHPLNAF